MYNVFEPDACWKQVAIIARNIYYKAEKAKIRTKDLRELNEIARLRTVYSKIRDNGL